MNESLNPVLRSEHKQMLERRKSVAEKVYDVLREYPAGRRFTITELHRNELPDEKLHTVRVAVSKMAGAYLRKSGRSGYDVVYEVIGRWPAKKPLFRSRRGSRKQADEPREDGWVPESQGVFTFKASANFNVAELSNDDLFRLFGMVTAEVRRRVNQ